MGVKIDIGKNRYLMSDENQYWIAKERKSKKGEVYYTRLSGYHQELDNLLDSYMDKALRDSDVTTLQDFGKEIKKLRSEIRKWLKEVKEGAK